MIPKIDITELGLGALGVAGSVYDPWIGDPFAPVLVTLTRTVGMVSLAGLGLLLLAAGGREDIDPTKIAVIFFAAGAAAPNIARGAWSIIDMATMFDDLMYESYKPVTRGSSPGKAVNGSNRKEIIQACKVDSIEVCTFFAWTVAVFLNLMRHNVSFHKLSPYARDFFRAIGNNIEKLFRGKSAYDTTPEHERWDWSMQSWSKRLKALLNLLILHPPGIAFLILQLLTTFVEGLFLAFGSIVISIAVAAHKGTLMNDRGNRGNPEFQPVRPDEQLRHVVEDLICCPTCNHRVDDRGHMTGRSSSDNTKAYLDIMPNVRKTSMGTRGNGNSHLWNLWLERLRCPFSRI